MTKCGYCGNQKEHCGCSNKEHYNVPPPQGKEIIFNNVADLNYNLSLNNNIDYSNLNLNFEPTFIEPPSNFDNNFFKPNLALENAYLNINSQNLPQIQDSTNYNFQKMSDNSYSSMNFNENPSNSFNDTAPNFNPEEKDKEELGIWVVDRYNNENMFYFGSFPSSILANSTYPLTKISETMSNLIENTNIEDELCELTMDLNFNTEISEINKPEMHISNAAKRHILGLYWRFCHPFFPVIHRSTVMIDFDNGKFPSLLMFAILAITFPYTNNESKKLFPTELQDKSRLEVCKQFELEAKKQLDECFSESDIYTIQALLLLTLIPNRSNFSNNCWLYSGMATRMAMELGLHKDCENLLNGQFDSEEQEIRKKTWWGCFILDALFSVMVGRPLSIQVELCDVKLPKVSEGVDPFANLDQPFIVGESIIGSGVNKRPNSDEKDETKEALSLTIFIYWSKLSIYFANINKLLTSIKQSKRLPERSEKAKEIILSLKNWYKSLPTQMQNLNPQSVASINFDDASHPSMLLPLLHCYYHIANIICLTVIDTDEHFRFTTKTSNSGMKEAYDSADLIIQIMKDFSSVFNIFGPNIKFYPLYLSSFYILNRIKIIAGDRDCKLLLNLMLNPESNNSELNEEELKIFKYFITRYYTALTFFKNGIKNSQNFQFSLDILVGIAKSLNVPIPDQFIDLITKPRSKSQGQLSLRSDLNNLEYNQENMSLIMNFLNNPQNTLPIQNNIINRTDTNSSNFDINTSLSYTNYINNPLQFEGGTIPIQHLASFDSNTSPNNVFLFNQSSPEASSASHYNSQDKTFQNQHFISNTNPHNGAYNVNVQSTSFNTFSDGPPNLIYSNVNYHTSPNKLADNPESYNMNLFEQNWQARFDSNLPYNNNELDINYQINNDLNNFQNTNTQNKKK